MSEEAIDTSEHPEWSDEEFAAAIARRGLEPTPPKKQVTLRLDADVLEWFKSQGKGYQTRINALLRSYMEVHQRD